MVFIKLTPGVRTMSGSIEAGDTQISTCDRHGARDTEDKIALAQIWNLDSNVAASERF